MADNNSQIVNTTIDNNVSDKKDEKVVTTGQHKPKNTSSYKMPPPIIGYTSSAGSSKNTRVTDTILGSIPTGHVLSGTSAGTSPLETPSLKQHKMPYMQPQHGLQFLQSPNPAYGGYQPGFFGMSPPPAYAGFPMPYPQFPAPQMGFDQPSFEDDEEEGEELTSELAEPQQEGAEEECSVPLPVSLFTSKIEKRAVQQEIVQRMSDALYQSDLNDLKNVRELAVEKAYLPANMVSPVPKMEGKLLSYISQDCVKEDTSSMKLQETIWMLLQPIVRSFEKIRGSSSTQKEAIMYILQISIQGYCALLADLTRKRRAAIKKDTIGYIDFRPIADAEYPAASDSLFGGLLAQAFFTQKRIKGKTLNLALKRKGLSDRVIETISKSRRDVTDIQYDRVRDKYFTWCKLQGRDPFGDDIATPLEFMQFLMDEDIKPTHGKDKRGYSCMRIASSALSSILAFEGVPFGQHYLAKSFMKGVLNERPITHRYQVQWDAQRVIDKLKNSPFVPAHRLSLLLLAKKTLFLILMATSRRVHISKALCISEDKCSRTKSRVLFHIERKDLKQGGSMKKKPAPLEVRAFPKNRRVDPVLYIEEYIKRTESVRGDIPQLFLTTKGPTRPISKDTARNWVKDILQKCGVNVNQFGPGSTRGASSSTASALGVSLEEILKAGEWSNASVWQTYYHKPVVKRNKSVADVLLS